MVELVTAQEKPAARGSHDASIPRPVFLVGMPRSGTKLLRELLNSHPSVAIFPHESHFIPFFHQRFGARVDLADRHVFHDLFRAIESTTFGQRMAARGLLVSEVDWRGRMEGGTYADALRALFASYRALTGRMLVGDKTPEYLTQIPLLSQLFPDARFIHIVRDPRDYALSIRNAWNKNMSRAVYRWKRHIRKYIKDTSERSLEQLTIRYEDLVGAPELVLSRVCEFLGIPFDPTMTTMRESSENLGDARGMRLVKTDNTRKWMEGMSRAELKETERIAGTLMVELGYQPVGQAGDADLSVSRELAYRVCDAVNLFRCRLRSEGGLVAALGESWRAHRHSGVDE